MVLKKQNLKSYGKGHISVNVILCLRFPLIIYNVLSKLVVPIVKTADYDNVVPSQLAMLADVLLFFSYPNSFSRCIKFYPCILLSYKILSISFLRSYLSGLNSAVNSNFILRKLLFFPQKDYFLLPYNVKIKGPSNHDLYIHTKSFLFEKNRF